MPKLNYANTSVFLSRQILMPRCVLQYWYAGTLANSESVNRVCNVCYEKQFSDTEIHHFIENLTNPLKYKMGQLHTYMNQNV